MGKILLPRRESLARRLTAAASVAAVTGILLAVPAPVSAAGTAGTWAGPMTIGGQKTVVGSLSTDELAAGQDVNFSLSDHSQWPVPDPECTPDSETTVTDYDFTVSSWELHEMGPSPRIWENAAAPVSLKAPISAHYHGVFSCSSSSELLTMSGVFPYEALAELPCGRWGLSGWNPSLFAAGGGGDFASIAIPLVDGTFCNHPPVANADSFAVAASSTLSLDVLANDTDPDGDPILITGATQPHHGTITVTPTQISYQADVTGAIDQFTYSIADGLGGTASATVTINDVGPDCGGEAAIDHLYSTVDGNAYLDLPAAPDPDLGDASFGIAWCIDSAGQPHITDVPSALATLSTNWALLSVLKSAGFKVKVRPATATHTVTSARGRAAFSLKFSPVEQVFNVATGPFGRLLTKVKFARKAYEATVATKPAKAAAKLRERLVDAADDFEDFLETSLANNLSKVPGISKSQAKRFADHITDALEEFSPKLAKKLFDTITDNIRVVDAVKAALNKVFFEVEIALWTVDVSLTVHGDGTASFTNQSTTAPWLPLLHDKWATTLTSG